MKKATLKLKNIGQRIGEEVWEFNSGVVTEIRGRTASGKSRILKSCALALSLPINSEEIRKDAVGFGIADADGSKHSPLLNSNKDEASIELKYEENDDEIIKIVELKRNNKEEINTPGNEKFLYCSMLVENSIIHNSIEQGISDFSWIVTEMSLAKEFEAVQDIIKSYSEVVDAKKEEILKEETEMEVAQNFLKKKNQELKDVNNEIEKIEVDINAIQINPQLKQERIDAVENLKDLSNKQRDDRSKLKSLQNNLSEVDRNLNNNSEIIQRNSVKMGELVDGKKKLQKIDVKTLNDIIENLRVENENLYKSEKNELQKIGGFKNDKRRLELVLKELGKTKKVETLCWTCGKSTISKNEVNQELEIVEDKIKPLQEKINKIEHKIEKNNDDIIQKQKQKNLKSKINEIDKQIKEYDDKTLKLKREKDGLENEIKRINSQIPKYEANIKSKEVSIQQKEKSLKEIEKKLEEHKLIKPKLDKKNNLTKKLGGIEKEISDIEIKINQGEFIELFNFSFSILQAKEILKDMEEIFQSINSYLVLNIKEQREGAANKFNENINKIIDELNFSEFKEIYLDLEDYNLKIIRSDNTNQPINSLSGGEKIVVSSLLQISAKETYNPDIPFIVGDDIILKMDDSRRKIFENYLKNLAKEKDWFIILTRVTDEDLIKSEI